MLIIKILFVTARRSVMYGDDNDNDDYHNNNNDNNDAIPPAMPPGKLFNLNLFKLIKYEFIIFVVLISD